MWAICKRDNLRAGFPQFTPHSLAVSARVSLHQLCPIEHGSMPPVALEDAPTTSSPEYTSDSEDTHHRKRYRRLARTAIARWRKFVRQRRLQRTLALAKVRNFLADCTDDYLASTILAFVRFQVKPPQVFENNPGKESRQRAIEYFREIECRIAWWRIESHVSKLCEIQ